MSKFGRRLQQGTTPLAPVVTPPVEPQTGVSPAYWSKWSNGPSTSDTWFPIAAWQAHIDSNFNGIVSPYSDLGAGMADAGINVIDGTWDWLDTIGASYVNRAIALNMKIIASGPNMAYLQANPTHASAIIGWQTGDEFDMFRANESGPYGENSPTSVYNRYVAAKAQDPSRPQHINYGKPMGGGYYNANGGTDTATKDGDLKLYQQAADMTSVDYYWYTDPWENLMGAYLYGYSVDMQRRYARMADTEKPVWMFIENSRPWDITSIAITPFQMEAAIWSSIVHGARGIVYFTHDFGGGQQNISGEIGVWATNYYDRTTGDAIIAKMKLVNGRIKALAPVLNSAELGTIDPESGREVADAYITVASSTSGVPIDVMVRQYNGQTYVFAQASGSDTNQASGNTTGTFTWLGGGSASVIVRDESRSVSKTNGVWTDTFTPYQLHIYVF
jgi:hypothetical protein